MNLSLDELTPDEQEVARLERNGWVSRARDGDIQDELIEALGDAAIRERRLRNALLAPRSSGRSPQEREHP